MYEKRPIFVAYSWSQIPDRTSGPYEPERDKIERMSAVEFVSEFRREFVCTKGSHRLRAWRFWNSISDTRDVHIWPIIASPRLPLSPLLFLTPPLSFLRPIPLGRHGLAVVWHVDTLPPTMWSARHLSCNASCRTRTTIINNVFVITEYVYMIVRYEELFIYYKENTE